MNHFSSCNQKKDMGRPRLPESELRSTQMIIRLSVAEKALIDSAHENVSAWARELLLKAAAKQRTIEVKKCLAPGGPVTASTWN